MNNYKERFLKVAEEGYDAAAKNQGAENPYDFLESHYEWSAWATGSYFYLSNVH